MGDSVSAEKVSWPVQPAEEAGLGHGERALLPEGTGVRQWDTRERLPRVNPLLDPAPCQSTAVPDD